MDVTFFSFSMAILWCNVYIAVIALIRRRNSFLMCFSAVPLIFLIFVSVFRLIFSVEFPFTIVLPSVTILPAVFTFINMPLFTFANDAVTICVSHVLIILWIGGCIYHLQKYIFAAIRLNSSLTGLPETRNPRILSMMDELVGKSRINAKIRIVQSEVIAVPTVTGFFKPTICLPDMTLSDTDIKNILSHELTHFLHKDLWLKLFMYLINSVFWWNPFIHQLNRDLSHILEIRCDLSLASEMSEEERSQYLKSISRVAARVHTKKLLLQPHSHTAAFVSTRSMTKIEQRFHLVLDYNAMSKPRRFLNLILCGLILLSVFISYLFVIQPIYSPANDAEHEETYIVSPKDSYLRLNEDGTYQLYINDQHVTDVEQINKEPISSLPIK